LERVRAGKLAASAARLVDRGRFNRWTMIAPWVRPRQITAVITSVKAQAAAEIHKVRSEQVEQVAKLTGEQAAANERADSLAADLTRLRDALPEQIAAAVQAVREQEQAAREQVEQALREQIQREREARAEQDRRTATRTEPAKARQTGSDQRKPAPQVSQLRSDEQIADALSKSYREQMEGTGSPLSRYRVEVDGDCSTRQANRVLDLLANRYLEQSQRGANRSSEQVSVQQDRTDADDDEHHPASRELAGEPIAAGGTR
jgi:hypothetical protein